MSETVTKMASRVGDLVLENGYPTPATAALLYDTMDSHRATQAYIWALPAIGFKSLYDAHPPFPRRCDEGQPDCPGALQSRPY